MKKITIFKAVKLIAAFSLVLFLAGCGGGGGGGSEIKPEGVIIHVQPSPTLPSDGKSWASAYKNLQDVLSVAESGSEIWVAAGTYTPGIDRASSFTLKDGVAVYGGFNGTETSRDARDWTQNVTILSGDIGTPGDNTDNCYHVVKGANNAILDGFTVSKGFANGDNNFSGAGMQNFQVNPTVRNCTFSDNIAGNLDYYNTGGQGGGINNHESSPTITNCIFVGNAAAVGGGGVNNSLDCHPIITNCTFTGNTSRYGGGMFNDKSSPTVTSCTFINNSADIGGALCSSGNPVITGCTFTGNTAASNGGGIILGSGSVKIKDSVISGNYSESGGGGIEAQDNLTLINCIISNNSVGAQSQGGGLRSGENTTLVNCIFSGNSAGYGGGMVNWGSSIIVNCTFSGNSSMYGGGLYTCYNSTTQIINSILWGKVKSRKFCKLPSPMSALSSQ